MNRDSLIVSVILNFLKQSLSNEESGSLRFCMLGWRNRIIVDTASEVSNSSELGKNVLVKINSKFDQDNELNEDLVQDETLTFWRNCHLKNRRAILFAANSSDLQSNQKSTEKITKIETENLRKKPELWLDACGLSGELSQKDFTLLMSVLKAVDESRAAMTIDDFADFILSVDDNIQISGDPVLAAIDHALPALKLPKNSGQFKLSFRKKTNGWKEKFENLHKNIRPKLVLQDLNGESIQSAVWKKFVTLRDKGEFDQSDAQIIEDFLNEDLVLNKWSATQADFCELDWLHTRRIFERQRRRTKNIFPRTYKLFDDNFPEKLTQEVKDLLNGDPPGDPVGTPTEEFFVEHRNEIGTDSNLIKDWESYIFKEPKTYRNFEKGLLETILQLYSNSVDKNGASKGKIFVTIHKSETKEYWESKNIWLLKYFTIRHLFLSNYLSDIGVEFDFGKLQSFNLFSINDDAIEHNYSAAKEATQIKFEVNLQNETNEEEIDSNVGIQFVWRFIPNSIAKSLLHDITTLANGMAKFNFTQFTSEVEPQIVSVKGHQQNIDIENVNTFSISMEKTLAS